MSGSLYVHLVAWAAPHVTSLDGQPFVHPRGARASERGLLQRVVPGWVLRMVGSLVQILKSKSFIMALHSDNSRTLTVENLYQGSGLDDDGSSREYVVNSVLCTIFVEKIYWGADFPERLTPRTVNFSARAWRWRNLIGGQQEGEE